MGGRLSIRVTAAVLAAVALSACGPAADDATTAAGDPTASAPVTATTGTPTDRPEDPAPEQTETLDPWRFGPPGVTMNMRYDTEEGATEFVEYYLQTYNYANATHDTEQLDQISHLNCVGCDAALDAIAQLAEDGVTVSGLTTSIEAIDSVTYYPDSTIYIIDATLTDSPGELLNAAGEAIQEAEEETYTTGFGVRFLSPMEWTMISFGGGE